MAQDLTIRKGTFGAGREIKASHHYSYVQAGITLDGSKFAAGALVLEGQCLVKDDATGMYEPYADAAGAFPAGKSHAVILDESVQFRVDDAGANPTVTAGQVIEHGAVFAGMLIGLTAAFRTAVGTRIIFR